MQKNNRVSHVLTLCVKSYQQDLLKDAWGVCFNSLELFDSLHLKDDNYSEKNKYIHTYISISITSRIKLGFGKGKNSPDQMSWSSKDQLFP